MHGFAVYVKKGLPFKLISRKLCRFLFMLLSGFTSLSVLLLFPLSITFFSFAHGFDSTPSNIDEVLLSLETLTSIIRTSLPVLVGLMDLVNSVVIFLSQMTLLRWLIFLLGSQTVNLIVPFLWIFSFF